MNCPKCNIELEKFVSGGITFDFCVSSCKGIWADVGELAAALPGGEDFPFIREDEIQGQKTNILCPSCGDAKLLELPYEQGEDLAVDYCKSCRGVWMDFKEFGEIKKTVDYYVENSKEFRKKISEEATKAAIERRPVSSWLGRIFG